jgi:peptidyl-prolyl cis-trans isomerase A (cyclophilin A)
VSVTRLILLLIAAECLFAQNLPNGLYAAFHTSLGDITARLYEKDTPVTVENFVALAQGTKPTRLPKTGKLANVPLYTNITFHRVLPGVMIQSGDPTGTGSHECGVTIQDEILPGLRFDGAGRLAMANTGDPNSGGCQFFFTLNSMREWDGKYTIFGLVVEGQDVVDKIGHTPVRGDKPVNPPKLISVTIERVGPEPVKKKKRK